MYSRRTRQVKYYMEALILASSSPRRQEILKMIGIPFVVNPADIAEKIPQDVDPRDAPEYLACKKVEAVAQRISSVQDADKIVVLDGGRINGVGTHEELLENNAIYREVYTSQMHPDTEKEVS